MPMPNNSFLSEPQYSDEDFEYLMESLKLRSRDNVVIRYEDMIRLDEITFINSLIMLIRSEGNPEWSELLNHGD